MKNYRSALWSLLFVTQAAWATEETTPVVVTANADCAVYADGELVHAALKANAVHKIQLSPGEHLLAAACAGRQPWKQVIQVSREQKVVQIETAASGVTAPSPAAPTVGTPQPAAPSPTPLDLNKQFFGSQQSADQACAPSAVWGVNVLQYVSGFANSGACRGTLRYDVTQISFTPETTFAPGFAASYMCQALCLATSEVESIKENVLQGRDVGAFHVKLNNGTTYNFAPAGGPGFTTPEKFRTKGVVKAFREKTGK